MGGWLSKSVREELFCGDNLLCIRWLSPGSVLASITKKRLFLPETKKPCNIFCYRVLSMLRSQDSNLELPDPESGALPIWPLLNKVQHITYGTPERIRTSNRLIRSQILYPVELRVQQCSVYGIRTRDLRLERAMSWATRRTRHDTV